MSRWVATRDHLGLDRVKAFPPGTTTAGGVETGGIAGTAGNAPIRDLTGGE